MGALLREIFSDGKGILSSFRIMAMIGLLSGCGVMLAQIAGYGCDVNLESTLAILFGAIYGGKAFQKKQEG